VSEQLLLFSPQRPAPPADDVVTLRDRELPVLYKKNLRARHYLIYLRRDASIRVTIPRGGTKTEAAAFVRVKHRWIQRQWDKMEAPSWPPRAWQAGTRVWFEGQEILLRKSAPERGHCGPLSFTVPSGTPDWRPLVEEHLRLFGKKNLPERAWELAALYKFQPKSVTIRSQSTRWGSCSQARRISLNWRLVQVPPAVRDYVIVHELAHLRHLNHSKQFWSLVSRLMPDYPLHEKWLKTHAARLGL